MRPQEQAGGGPQCLEAWQLQPHGSGDVHHTESKHRNLQLNIYIYIRCNKTFFIPETQHIQIDLWNQNTENAFILARYTRTYFTDFFRVYWKREPVIKWLKRFSQRCHRRTIFGSTKNHSFIKEHLFLTFSWSKEPSFTTKNILWNRKFLRMLKVPYGTI